MVPSILSMLLIKKQAMPTFQTEYIQECIHTGYTSAYLHNILPQQSRRKLIFKLKTYFESTGICIT